MKQPQPLEIDVAREAREIRRLAPAHHLAWCGPELVAETAELIVRMRGPAGLGYRASMRLLKNLSALGMSPMARARCRLCNAMGSGGGDDAA
jgi:hypothetical protein